MNKQMLLVITVIGIVLLCLYALMNYQVKSAEKMLEQVPTGETVTPVSKVSPEEIQPAAETVPVTDPGESDDDVFPGAQETEIAVGD